MGEVLWRTCVQEWWTGNATSLWLAWKSKSSAPKKIPQKISLKCKCRHKNITTEIFCWRYFFPFNGFWALAFSVDAETAHRLSMYKSITKPFCWPDVPFIGPSAALALWPSSKFISLCWVTQFFSFLSVCWDCHLSQDFLSFLPRFFGKTVLSSLTLKGSKIHFSSLKFVLIYFHLFSVDHVSWVLIERARQILKHNKKSADLHASWRDWAKFRRIMSTNSRFGVRHFVGSSQYAYFSSTCFLCGSIAPLKLT
jgi:hypothetical protein